VAQQGGGNQIMSGAAIAPAAPTTATEDIDDDVKRLAAMAYGEASSRNVKEEMYAIASVLERQRAARGFATIKALGEKDKSFSFVTSDGNKRYAKLLAATAKQIEADPGMKEAIAAAKNAKTGGVDYSNGAYFWDGADIKSNYAQHFKVKNGIKITSPAHNIYDIKDSTKLVIINKVIKKKIKGKIVTTKVEVGRYDHVYESTAGHGGTIFWKQADDYLKVTKSKPYL
jgi:hypothetical protein